MTLQEIEHLWKWASNNPDHDTNWHDPVVVAFANLVSALERPWVGLTDADIKEIIGGWGDTPIKGYTRKFIDRLEAKLKEKNT